MTASIDTTALELCADIIDLSRPLAILDIETTGIDVEGDSIIQVGIARIEPDGSIETFSTLIDPGIPVPDEVQELTGITTEMLVDEPAFFEVSDEINRLLGDADLCGYNLIRFDLPFLKNEFASYGMQLQRPENQQVLDVYQVFRKREPHTLERAVTHYTGQPHTQSHQALDDVAATSTVLANQLTRYGFVGRLEDIVADARRPHLDAEGKLKAEGDTVVICFGKYKGYTIRDVHDSEPSYLNWMIREIGGEVAQIVKERREAIDNEFIEDVFPDGVF